MNTLQKLLVCLMLGFVVVGYGCNDDDDDPVGCANWANEVSAEGTAYSNALVAYYSVQTPANCQAAKVAGQAYVSDLQAHVECASLSGHQAEVQTIINGVQAEVDALSC